MCKRRFFSSGAALFVSALLVAGAALLFSACESDGGKSTAPVAPAKPAVTAGTEQLTVSWNVVEDAQYYEVHYGTSETGDKSKWEESHTATTVTITGLTGDTLYYVWIKAGNAAGLSGFSPPATGTPIKATQPPAAPAKPAVVPGNATLTVTWDPVTGASSYEIYYAAAGAAAPAADTAAITTNVAINGTTATITGLTNGTEYSVYVRAKNSVGTSAWSEAEKGTPVLPIPAKSVITVASGHKQLTVTWDAVTDAASYEVYYAEATAAAPTADTAAITTGVTISGTTATITGLTNGTEYSVYVRAVNAAGKSAWSDVKKAMPVVGTPAITVISKSDGFTVSWDTVTDATAYDVYYHTTGTAPTGDTAVSAADVAGTTHTVTTTMGAAYHVWVRAKDAGGPGAYSEPKIALYNLSAMYLEGFHQTAVSYSPGWSGNEWVFIDDGFAINSGATDTFTYYETSTGLVGYEGNIVGIVAEDETSGRIIIEITSTQGGWYPTSGKYYAVAYKNASSYGINEASAYKGADGQNSGVDTPEEAVAEYVYDNGSDPGGYFAMYGNYYTKTVAPKDLTALHGTWIDDDSGMFIITIRGTTLVYFIDGDGADEIYAPDDDEDDFLAIAGDIVAVTLNTNAGILFIHTVVPGDDGTGYMNDKFEAIAWKESTGQYSFSVQQDSFTSLIEAQTKYTDATNTTQFLPGSFTDYTKQP